MGEQLERDTTVLFAQVLGGAGVTTLQACMAQLRKTAEDCGARAFDSGNDRLMVLLATPDAAADAAAAMHTSMDHVPQYGGARLGLGIGFHHGPAIQKEDQVYGDTVNLAAQLVAKAANGQIITTRETASHFSPIYRAWMRKLGSIQIKDDQASRLHCTIERRQDKFVLTDHSTNGTYVKINSAPEVLVQREEFALTGKGTIACGQPAVSTKEIVQFELGAES